MDRAAITSNKRVRVRKEKRGGARHIASSQRDREGSELSKGRVGQTRVPRLPHRTELIKNVEGGFFMLGEKNGRVGVMEIERRKRADARRNKQPSLMSEKRNMSIEEENPHETAV